MAQVILQQILEQIKILDPDDLWKVSQAVQERLAAQREMSKCQAFHQALYASGLVRHTDHKARPLVELSKRQLVQVRGQPVSETIIEERR